MRATLRLELNAWIANTFAICTITACLFGLAGCERHVPLINGFMLHHVSGTWVINCDRNELGAPVDAHTDSDVLAVAQHSPYILAEVRHAGDSRPNDRWLFIDTVNTYQRWFDTKAELQRFWSTLTTQPMPPFVPVEDIK